MRQLFAPSADAWLRLVFFSGIAGLVLLIALIGGLPNSMWSTGVATARAQPVPFSHKHHSGELGINCLYCHTQVLHYADAGMPPTHTCMTCHSQIWTNAPMLAPVRESFATDTPLDWQRVNRLPDYVYYNHAAHVTHGIGCSTCHGPVNQMQLTWKAQNFTMKFCLDCHRAPQRYVRESAQVWNMEWQPPANQEELGRKLLVQYHIHAGPRLTDCSICHR